MTSPLRLPRVLLVSMLLGTLAAPVVAADPKPILIALTEANDALIQQTLLQRAPERGARGVGEKIMVLAAAFTNEHSPFFHDPRLVPALATRIDSLGQMQRRDGLFDMGNLDSPPDSAFVLKTLARGQFFLTRDAAVATQALREKLQALILTTAEGVRQGGIHTPNHRWAVCSALAQVNQLYPNPAYVQRIDEWLAEGLDIDAEGQWSERSPNYNAHVNNPSILEVSLLLKRPALLDAVRRNLEMSWYYAEANGEVETVASRRQDQDPGARKYLWEYYVPYRYLAVRDQNPRFAAVTRRLERDGLAEIGADATNMSSALVLMREFPEMAGSMPPDAALSVDFAKVFKLSGVARIRRGEMTATVFGGNDWHLGLGAGSGLSTNPAFFKFRKGAAVLESVRLTPMFFTTGFFYPEGLKVTGENEYELTQTVSVPYHLPLPVQHLKPDGVYPLTPDGRIFFRLDYASRQQDLKTLTTKVVVREVAGAFVLDFDVQGLAGVPVALELCFRKGGTFTGVMPSTSGEISGERSPDAAAGDDAKDNFFLKEGVGRYTVGADTITFGPGSYRPLHIRMEGLEYANYKGQNRADGYRVYLSGVTPFKRSLTIK
ncbi:MAG: hypothetical protein DUW69_000764 [Verrucomicrobia bacterium]|jgi:hypothetical protein|nr:MAG: hypothetical protein DUW69_000764 [Verrucomicrobiota bacterium]